MDAIYFESLEMEFDELLETCTNEINAAFYRANNAFFEDGEQENKKSGGLIEFIKSCVRTLIDFIKGLFKKIKEVFSSSEVDKSKENETVQFRDINKENEIICFIEKDAAKMVKDAKDGKLSYDKAEEYVKNNEDSLGKVGTAVIALGSLFRDVIKNSETMNKFTDELDGLVNANFEEVNDSVTKMTRMSSKENRDAEKRRVVNLLLNHYKLINASSSKHMLDAAKVLAAKHYLYNRINHEYKMRTDADYAKEANKKEKEKMKERDKKADKLVRDQEHQKAMEKTRKKQIKTQAANQNRLIRTKQDMYDDYDGEEIDVDTDGQRTNYTAGDSVGGLMRRAKGAVTAKVKNLKSRHGLK